MKNILSHIKQALTDPATIEFLASHGLPTIYSWVGGQADLIRGAQYSEGSWRSLLQNLKPMTVFQRSLISVRLALPLLLFRLTVLS